MSSISIAIADQNQIYAQALSEYLQSHYGQAFQICCLTDSEALKEYIEIGDIADIMLIDQDLFADEYCALQAKMVFILMEDSQYGERKGVKALYKYQPADKLVREILQNYALIESKPLRYGAASKEPALIAVYSASGGAGKSTIAFHLAKQYAMQGRKPLLISLESHSALSLFTEQQKGRGLSYLLYLTRNKTSNLVDRVIAMSELDISSNIYYLPRDLNSLEYKDWDQNDLTDLLDLLKKQSEFDALLFDMDSTYSNSVLSMFKHADVIVNVIAGDFTAKAKNHCFQRQAAVINKLLNIDLSKKMISVNNKVENQTGITSDSGNSIEVNIPYIKDYGQIEHGYFPELIHFKQLYHAVDALAEGRENGYDSFRIRAGH